MLKPETVKVLEENLGDKLLDNGLGNNILDLTPKVQATEAKINKTTSTKKYLHSKENN